MAWFTKKEWKNRLAEFAGRRTLTDVATGASQVVDVARNEGTISQEGDAFSAANMNDFEQRILEGFVAAENANAELNQNFQDGVNTIVSAVNTKAGTSLTGKNTPVEIANVITNIETAKDMLLISCHDGGANTSQMSSAPCAVMRINDHKLNESTWYGYLVNTPTTLANAVKLEYTYTNGWVVTALKALTYYDGQSKSQKSLAKNATITWAWNAKRNLLFYL